MKHTSRILSFVLAMVFLIGSLGLSGVVHAEAVTGVTLDKTVIYPLIGTPVQLTATVQPTGATNQNVTWTSANTNIAEVDTTGKVTAKTTGQTTVTVTTEDGSKTATCTVKVGLRVYLTSNKATVAPGETVTVYMNLAGVSNITSGIRKIGTGPTAGASFTYDAKFSGPNAASELIQGSLYLATGEFTPYLNTQLKQCKGYYLDSNSASPITSDGMYFGANFTALAGQANSDASFTVNTTTILNGNGTALVSTTTDLTKTNLFFDTPFTLSIFTPTPSPTPTPTPAPTPTPSPTPPPTMDPNATATPAPTAEPTPPSGNAAVYVDGAAATNGTGTLESPYNSLSASLTGLTAGKTLYIRGGTYILGATTLSNNGTVNSPIWVLPYPGESVKITKDAADTTTGTLITLSGSYWNIQGLEFTGYTNRLAEGNSVIRVTGASNVLLNNLNIHNNLICGVVILGGSSNVTVNNCDIYRNGNYYNYSCGGAFAGGIQIETSTGVKVTGNRVYENAAAGIRIGRNADNVATVGNVDIVNNWVFENGFDYTGQYPLTGLSYGSGFYIDSSANVSANSRIYIGRNLIVGNNVAPIRAQGNSTQYVVFTNNTMYRNMQENDLGGGKRSYTPAGIVLAGTFNPKSLFANNLIGDNLKSSGNFVDQYNPAFNTANVTVPTAETAFLQLPDADTGDTGKEATTGCANLQIDRQADGQLPMIYILRPSASNPGVGQGLGVFNSALKPGGTYYDDATLYFARWSYNMPYLPYGTVCDAGYVAYDSNVNVPTLVITGVANNGYYKTARTITFNEGTATLNGNPFVSGTVVSANDSYTLIVTDKNGKPWTINFTIFIPTPEPSATPVPTPAQNLSVLYVDGSAAVSGNGSIGSPFNNLGTALQGLTAGKILYVRGGNYTLNEITISNNGTANAPIWVMPYNNETVTISGTFNALKITGSYWHIRGLNFTGYLTPTAEAAVIKISSPASHVELSQVNISNNKVIALWLDQVSNIGIYNCDISTSGNYASTYSADTYCGLDAGGGITIKTSSDVKISGCRVFENAGPGIHISGTVGNIDILNCYILKNGYDPQMAFGATTETATGGDVASGVFSSAANSPGTHIWVGYSLLAANRKTGIKTYYNADMVIIITQNITWLHLEQSMYIEWGASYAKGTCANNIFLDSVNNIKSPVMGVGAPEGHNLANPYEVDATDSFKFKAVPSTDLHELLAPRQSDGSLANSNYFVPDVGSPALDTAFGVDNGKLQSDSVTYLDLPNARAYWIRPFFELGAWSDQGYWVNHVTLKDADGVAIANGGVSQKDVTLNVGSSARMIYATKKGYDYYQALSATGTTVLSDEGEYSFTYIDNGVRMTYTFTIDKSAPVISGVENDGLYNHDITVDVQDATALIITVDDVPVQNGDKITTEGKHTLVAVDALLQSTTVTFTIDKTAPVVSGVADNATYGDAVTPTFDDGTATLNGDAFTSGTEVSAEGKYTLVVTDAAGNKATIKFAIDKTAPEINGITDKAYYKNDLTVNVTDTTDLVITLDGNTVQNGDIISQEGVHTLTATDAANLQTTVTFTLDKTAPTVQGVENGDFYNADITITFSDAFDCTATLNGNAFTSGTTVTVEDSYTLIVTDTAGNCISIQFTLDKTAPTVTGVVNNGNYKTDRTISFDKGTATLNGNVFESGNTVSSEGSYSLVITYSGDRTLTIAFTLDKTAPVVNGVTNNGIYKGSRGITFNEGTGKLNGNAFNSGTFVTAEGAYTLVVTDSAGNSTTVSFTIDKTAPVVSGVVNNGQYNVDKTITFNEGTATLNGSAFTSGSTVSDEGDYTLVVTDSAGNSTTVNFAIDKTAPVVSGVENNGLYNVNKTITFDDGTATLNGNAFESGNTVSSQGNYTLVVTDELGNSVTITFTIDKTAPTVTGVVDNGYYKVDVTITFSDGTATLNGNAFTSGSSVTTAGAYTLVVTDEAGNSTTVVFTIDKTAPVVGGVTNNAFYNVDKTVTITEVNLNTKTVTKDGAAFTWPSTNKFTTAGKYVLTVTDKAGNTTTITFTIDKTLPILTAKFGTKVVANGSVIAGDVVVTFADANLSGSYPVVTKNGVASTWPLGGKFITDGVYKVTYKDKAGNSTIITFAVNKTSPVITALAGGKALANNAFTNQSVTITLTSYKSITVKKYSKNGAATVNMTSTTQTFTTDGKYVITAVANGKTVTFTFTIDKTVPKVVVKNAAGTAIANNGTSKTTKATITITEANLSAKTITKNGVNMTWPSTNVVTAKGKYVVTVTDKAGNKTTYTFTVA